jgi:TorA maturation chaperone TorD
MRHPVFLCPDLCYQSHNFLKPEGAQPELGLEAVRPQTELKATEEEMARAAGYSLLGALLSAPPDGDLLERLRSLTTDPAAADAHLTGHWHALRDAATAHSAADIADEFDALFIGLGRGELMPYASVYLTGFLQEEPLADLRDDLAALGLERQGDVHEPEDHAAIVCEVMAALIVEPGEYSADQQEHFFSRHLQPWLADFFSDLAQADSARFYRSVGAFGCAFMELERRYFSMEV